MLNSLIEIKVLHFGWIVRKEESMSPIPFFYYSLCLPCPTFLFKFRLARKVSKITFRTGNCPICRHYILLACLLACLLYNTMRIDQSLHSAYLSLLQRFMDAHMNSCALVIHQRGKKTLGRIPVSLHWDCFFSLSFTGCFSVVSANFWTIHTTP